MREPAIKDGKTPVYVRLPPMRMRLPFGSGLRGIVPLCLPVMASLSFSGGCMTSAVPPLIDERRPVSQILISDHLDIPLYMDSPFNRDSEPRAQRDMRGNDLFVGRNMNCIVLNRDKSTVLCHVSARWSRHTGKDTRMVNICETLNITISTATLFSLIKAHSKEKRKRPPGHQFLSWAPTVIYARLNENRDAVADMLCMRDDIYVDYDSLLVGLRANAEEEEVNFSVTEEPVMSPSSCYE